MEDLPQYKSTIAQLETKVDMLESELSYLQEMLIRCGFSEGIATLKLAVEDLLKEEKSFGEEVSL